tara:strand:- start:120 stop:248 length:129 start_codon:yes stop_codon:yes gene_type:complete
MYQFGGISILAVVYALQINKLCVQIKEEEELKGIGTNENFVA